MIPTSSVHPERRAARPSAVGPRAAAAGHHDTRYAGRPSRPHTEDLDMATTDATGRGTRESPWKLQTPPATPEYQIYRDETADPPALVCQVGSTQLRYHLRCIEDLHAMLKAHGDWTPLGAADEQKAAAEGTVEAWGRSADNPAGVGDGSGKGERGRFGGTPPRPR